MVIAPYLKEFRTRGSSSHSFSLVDSFLFSDSWGKLSKICWHWTSQLSENTCTMELSCCSHSSTVILYLFPISRSFGSYISSFYTSSFIFVLCSFLIVNLPYFRYLSRRGSLFSYFYFKSAFSICSISRSSLAILLLVTTSLSTLIFPPCCSKKSSISCLVLTLVDSFFSLTYGFIDSCEELSSFSES